MFPLELASANCGHYRLVFFELFITFFTIKFTNVSAMQYEIILTNALLKYRFALGVDFKLCLKGAQREWMGFPSIVLNFQGKVHFMLVLCLEITLVELTS